MYKHLAILSLIALPLAVVGCSSTPSSSSGSMRTSAAAPATLSTPEIAPQLAALARHVRDAPSAADAASLSTPAIPINRQGRIRIHVYVKRLSSRIRHALSEAGATKISVSRPLDLYQYQAWAAPSAIARIATIKGVYKVAPPIDMVSTTAERY